MERGIIVRRGKKERTNSNTYQDTVLQEEYGVACPTISSSPISCRVMTMGDTIPVYRLKEVVYIDVVGTDYVIVGKPYVK